MASPVPARSGDHAGEVVVSHIELAAVRRSFERGERSATLSLDLRRTAGVAVALGPDGVELPDGRRLGWPAVERVLDSPNACFALAADGSLEAIRAFSPETDRLCQSVSPVPEAFGFVAGRPRR